MVSPHATPPADLDLLTPWLALAADYLRLLEQASDLENRRRSEVDYFQDAIRHDRDLRHLTGDSSGMKALRQAIRQVAATDSTVLITGETGTGKELVARAIHQLSPRRYHLLVTVNCAALNPSIITSELFGHEAGAFTGASKRRLGRFEVAHRGTLFLDEIAELPAETQVLLLRVLQERSFERVGGNEPITVDVRIVAATHQDLAELVRQGKFRADLFYRLNVFPLYVPPLRERRADIPDLVRHFLYQFNRRMKKQLATLTPDSLQRLLAYDWPGNVRELENLIERAMILAQGEELHIDSRWLTATTAASSDWRQRERQAILAALDCAQGKIYGPAGAAALLGLKPTTLYGKMRKLAIERPARNHQP